jgi:hypothetical protein
VFVKRVVEVSQRECATHRVRCVLESSSGGSLRRARGE